MRPRQLIHYLQTATQFVLAHACFQLAYMCVVSAASAATVEVQVLDRSGAPVRDVVVTMSPTQGESHAGALKSASNASRAMVMDQLNMMFTPQVLLVPTGTPVSFPNSDTVSHQVYSFSRTKPFQLPLYKGKSYPPVVFDKPGLVVLGCNIHDAMVGYIYVTDARWYGQTNAEGSLSLNDVAAGKVNVTIWSPVIADAKNNLSREVEVVGNKQELVFKLTKPLRSSPEPKPRRADWDY